MSRLKLLLWTAASVLSLTDIIVFNLFFIPRDIQAREAGLSRGRSAQRPESLPRWHQPSR